MNNETLLKNNRIEFVYLFGAFALSLLVYFGYRHFMSAPSVTTEQLLEKANLQYQEGLSLYKQQKINQAITSFEQAITTYPQHAAAYNNLTLCHLKLGNSEKAFELAQKSVAVNPHYAPSFVVLGELHQQRKEYEEAKKALETAVKLDGELFEGHLFLTYLLLRDNNQESIEHAMRHAKLALQLKPNNVDALMAIGYTSLALKDTPAATNYFQQVLTINPEHTAARSALAQVNQPIATT